MNELRSECEPTASVIGGGEVSAPCIGVGAEKYTMPTSSWLQRLYGRWSGPQLVWNLSEMRIWWKIVQVWAVCGFFL